MAEGLVTPGQHELGIKILSQKKENETRRRRSYGVSPVTTKLGNKQVYQSFSGNE